MPSARASFLFVLLALWLAVPAAAQQDRGPLPLPRWREGGTPHVPAHQSTRPFAIHPAALPGQEMPPVAGLIESPPEYSPCDGVLFRYHQGSWHQVVTDCVAALTGDPSHDELAYVVVKNSTQEGYARNAFLAAGADLSKVVFYTEHNDSIWLRDYGPHFIWQDGTLNIVDSHYYPTRPKDNFIPTLLAEDDLLQHAYPMGVYYSGGNFQPGPGRSGFVTSLVLQDNGEYTQGELASLYAEHQGIDTLHVMPRLPSSVDGTGHIDMWMYLVDQDSVIISQFLPGSNATAIQITDDAVPYMQALGFDVQRTPAWNVGNTHYTYTNAFRVNDRIFVPVYGPTKPEYLDEDALAMAAWAAAAGPNVELVPIDCASIIPAAGAIHCIVMQVPRQVDPLPAACLLSPEPGQLLVPGTLQQLEWAANDDQAVTAVDLDWSTDGGSSFQPIASGISDSGFLDWKVPWSVSANGLIRARVHDGDGHLTSSQNAGSCQVAVAARKTYDFSSGAGVDKWAWGGSPSSWSELNGQRHPASVSTSLDVFDPGAWVALAHSDASGDDSDPKRYISPTPAPGKESATLFEFQLEQDVASLEDVIVRWEGYADQCAQMELYVWDEGFGNWSALGPRAGQNHFAGNYAGNRDKTLELHFTEDLWRLVDPAGKLTLLAYVERPGDESFHDYVSVTSVYAGCQTDLGYAGPGAVVAALCGDDLTQDGSEALFQLGGAAPLAPVFLVLGVQYGPTPIKGGVLVPFPWTVLVDGLTTDVDGEWSLPVSGAAGAPTTLYLQAVVPNQGSLEFSNALEVLLGL